MYLKYSIGVDLSKGDFKANIALVSTTQESKTKASKTFKNNQAGFKEFISWVLKHCKEEVPILFVMEATGCYYEKLAWYLYQNNYQVAVLLPSQSKKFLQYLGYKSKTDKIDAKGLSDIGSMRKLVLWEPLSKQIYHLRMLTRMYEDIDQQRTAILNRLHSLEYRMYEFADITANYKKMLKAIEKQRATVMEAIVKAVREDKVLSERVENICTIKGVGLLTAAVVIAETNGFAMIKNCRQLVSFSGYDVVENESGNFKGRSKISKKGNTHIRRILYMPAINVVKFEPVFKEFYERIYERTNIKMKGYTAVQRKLLCLIYTLWKNNEKYDPQKNTSGSEEVEPSFRVGDEGALKKVVAPIGATQDELPSTVSAEALFSGNAKLKKLY